MKKNKIVTLTSFLAKIILSLLLVLILVLIAILIHWHFDKEFYSKVYLLNGFESGLQSVNLKISNNNLNSLALSNVETSFFYWFIFRSILIMVIVAYVTREYIKVLHSINNLKTFYKSNIKAFKRIAIMGVLLCIIASFNIGPFSDKILWHFTLPFGPILFTLINLALSEIFKEGKNYLEDSQSII